MATVAPRLEELNEEQIHDVLSNKRRKRTIERLKREQGHVSLRSLAEWIAEAESGESPPPTNVRQSVYNSLHQSHLPKLDDLGIVEYDDDRKEVSLRGEARAVDLYMEVLTPYGITWSTYYRTLALIGFFTIVVDQLDMLLLPGTFPLAIATVFLGIITVSTAYQLWSNQWIHLRGLMQDD